MDALIHDISTPRFKAITVPFISRQLATYLACLVLSITLFGGSVSAEPICKQATPPSGQLEHSKQLQQIWQQNITEPWFYDAEGQPSVLTIDNNWLAVRFANVFTSSSDMPVVMREFNQHYAEAFVDVVYNPAQPDLGLYRVKPTHRNSLINTIITEGDSTIRYILPAVITEGQSKIIGEQITVQWKSQIHPQRRQQLLHSIGAIDYSAELTEHEEIIQIDPCHLATWQAANRLAEDVQVIRALPEFLRVDAPIRVQFNLNSQGGVAGSALPFRLDIHFNDAVKIELGTLANLNLKPAGIFRNLFAVEYDTPLSAVDTRRSPIQLRGRLYLYASGEFELPSIPIFYRNASNDSSKVYRINTPVVSVRMAALVPEADGDYRLQVPNQLDSLNTLESSAQPHNSTLWQTLIATILLISSLTVALWHKRHNTQQQPPQTIEVTTTALQQLQQALELPQSLIKIGQALRYYLIDWADEEGLTTGGGSQLFFANLQPYIKSEYQNSIQQALQQLDVALARGISEEDTNKLLEKISQLVVTLEEKHSIASASRNTAVANP